MHTDPPMDALRNFAEPFHHRFEISHERRVP
jgi:hypothetical protein